MERRRVGVVAIALAACAAPSPRAAHNAAPRRAASSAPATRVANEAPAVDDLTDPSEPPPAPAPESEGTVLIIGDSHALGPFGWRLGQLLTRSAPRVVVEGACGATTETFVKSPKVHCGYEVVERSRDGTKRVLVSETGPAKTHTLETMMATFAPSVVVVVLGTNYPRAPVPESADEFMKQVCRDASCPRVFWIGPPSFGGLASGYISKSIKGVLDHWDLATFIDSTAFNEKTPLPLGTPHFHDAQARKWADYAFDRIAPSLAGGSR